MGNARIWETFLNSGEKSADLVLALEWENQRRKFVVEFKGQSAPSYLAGAIEQVRAYTAARPDLLPLVIVPYLGPKSLERLIAAGQRLGSVRQWSNQHTRRMVRLSHWREESISEFAANQKHLPWRKFNRCASVPLATELQIG